MKIVILISLKKSYLCVSVNFVSNILHNLTNAYECQTAFIPNNRNFEQLGSKVGNDFSEDAYDKGTDFYIGNHLPVEVRNGFYLFSRLGNGDPVHRKPKENVDIHPDRLEFFLRGFRRAIV